MTQICPVVCKFHVPVYFHGRNEMVTTMMIYCDKTILILSFKTYPFMLKIVEKEFHFLNLY